MTVRPRPRPARSGSASPGRSGAASRRSPGGWRRAAPWWSTPTRSARAVTAPGEPAHDADPGALRRRACAAPTARWTGRRSARLVFADPDALADLEAIVHPAVRPRILAAIEAADAAGAPAVVVEAIKLVEGGLAALCDEVWLVTCGPAAQRARLAARGLVQADAERRIAAQRDISARLRPHATRVIVTDGPPSRARRRVATALAAALRAHQAVSGD